MRFALDPEDQSTPAQASAYVPPPDVQTVVHDVSELQCAPNSFTTWTVVQAAWSILMAQYTGAREIRHMSAVKLGNKSSTDEWSRVNTSLRPVHAVVDFDTSVLDLFRQIQKQTTPETSPSAQQSQTHDSEHLAILQLGKRVELQNGAVEMYGTTLGRSYALMLLYQRKSVGAQFSLHYDGTVYDVERARQMMRQLEHLIYALSTKPIEKTRVVDLEMASANDLCDIWSWNASTIPPVHRCVHDMFAQMVQHAPDAPAICAWDGDLSYVELDAQSSSLARRLVTLGVGREVIVPLYFEKSKWTPVAMLAVMKAGGVSVALDTTLPGKRLQTIVEQVNPRIMLSSITNKARASRLVGTVTIVVPEQVLDHQTTPDGNTTPLPLIRSSDALYVIFTSGSTGTPKGVVITHSNYTSAIILQGDVGFHADSRVYDFASYAFDISWSNVLRTLLAGGCLCIPSEEDRQNAIAESFCRLRANHIDLTPSVARMIYPTSVPGLRHITFAGEPLRAKDVIPWQASSRVLNVYGPAECTVGALIYDIPKDHTDNPTIGRGSGVNTWIVDPDTQISLVPIGQVGELWLEGPLVARGYLANPLKTIEAFVDNPPWLLRGGLGCPGRRGRAYRTGDLVQYNADGSLVYIGRKDTQVKIHGQRVELSDVEHHVQQALPDNSHIVAELISPQQNGNPILVAFIDAEKESLENLTAGVNERLATQLPTYMIPNAYIPVHKIPQTATGKTDRRQLRSIAAQMSLKQLIGAAEKSSNEPMTEMENRLRDLWAAVLDLDSDSIGANDSFLQIGGSSIAAMRLVGMARERGLILSVASLFAHPQLRSLAQYVEVSRTKERQHVPNFALLIHDVNNKDVGPQVAKLLGVEPALVQDVFPCTPLQEGLLALSAKTPGNYTGQLVFELRDDVKLDRFRSAWDKIAGAASILRTRIVALPLQGVVQAVVAEPIEWTIHQGTEVAPQTIQHGVMGFGTPLCRFSLIDDQPNGKRFFVWTIHHAIYDGWSIPLLLREFEATFNQPDRVLAFEPFQHFVKHTLSLKCEAADSYWQSQLGGCEASIFPVLPSKTHEPRTDKVFEHQVCLEWPRTDITPSTIIRTALSILLSRHTATRDVVFGAVVFGRQAAVAGIEQMAGPTVATVPVRVQVDGDSQLADLCGQIQTQALEMTEFEQIGLQQIRRISRDTENATNFQVLLVIQPVKDEGDGKSSVFEDKVDPTDGDDNFSAYGLNFTCQLQTDGVQIRISFDSTMVAEQLASRLAHQLEHILHQLTTLENWSKKLSCVEWTGPKDLQDIWAWNASAPQRIERCVNDLIADMALEYPQAPAVCAWDGEMTYSVLDDLSTRLACHLIGLGISPGTIVPILSEKSQWVPVMVLAIMKAGGATVLLEPVHPDDRLQSILATLERPLVVLSSMTNESRARYISDATDKVVVPEPLLKDRSLEKDARLPEVHPSNNLYIVFTSGSTGVPKGAIVTHANYSSAVYHQRSTYDLTHSSRVYDFSSYAFDVAWLNLLFPLSVGGCICIPSHEDRQNNIAKSFADLNANWVHLTPSVARLLDPAQFSGLQHLCFGGEALLAEDVTRWWAVPKVTNSYGPAECTINVTMWSAKNNRQGSNPSIGWGCGTCPWVIDIETGESLASIGSIGELYVEGPLVGQGYLRDVEKTAAAFVRDPSWLLRGPPGQTGRRGQLYRTGDLVQYNPENGSLIYLGRKDAQIKINGQRIELGDIEHHVEQILRGKVDARVVADVITPSEHKKNLLVAFIHIPNDTSSTIQKLTRGLNEALAEQLPNYMLPYAYIPLPEVPMTATGKIDRRRLREIGACMTLQGLGALRAERTEYRAPSTNTERQLSALWATVLEINIDAISANDSFLLVGGDSISAMRLVGAAREAGLSLTVAEIFKHTRLSDLASVIQSSSETGPLNHSQIEPFSLLGSDTEIDIQAVRAQAAELCGVKASAIEDVFPCTALQEGLLALTVKKPGAYIDHTTYELSKNVDVNQFRAAWSEVVDTTPILRTRIVDLQRHGLVQVIVAQPASWSENNACPMNDCGEVEAMGLGTALMQLSMNKDATTGKHSFSWTIHHALFDAWSVSLVLRRVELAYKRQPMGTLAPFQRFVKYAKEHDKKAVTEYWRSQLESSAATPFPSLTSSNYQPQVDKILKHHVQELVWPRLDITPATVVRAAWSLLVSRYTDNCDVVFGVTSSGRQADVTGIESIAGPTIATVPVRVNVDTGKSIQDFMFQIQAQATNMVLFEQAGLTQIRRIGRDADQASQFQTLMVVQLAGQNESLESELFKTEEGAGKYAEDIPQTFGTYALEVICELQQNGLQLTFNYDSNVMGVSQVERMSQQLEHVLRLVCTEHGQKKIEEMEFTCRQDLEDIWTWNATVPPTAEECVHHVIGVVARRQPEAPAVCAWDGDFTYAELDNYSTRLAHRFVECGLGRDAVVPLCFEKSKWTPVTIMGVMKAGASSVLLDITLPQERLRTIVAQVKTPCILSSIANEVMANGLSNSLAVISPEKILQDAWQTTTHDLPAVDPSSPLYVVFTSGSTGNPKGVVITHSNFASLLQVPDPREASSLRLYDFASYSFDVSWSNVLLTFAAGACLCIPSQEDRRTGTGIAASIRRLKADATCLTPSVARLLDPSQVPGLRTLTFGGEAVTSQDIEPWQAHPVRLFNLYGPAECTVYTVGNEIIGPSSGSVSIGKGRGAKTWIVDQSGKSLVPVGAVGELWLEGPLVSPGYLSNPENTTAAFLQDPSWLLRGSPINNYAGRSGRLYRTGDLVRYNMDGSIVYVGRKDTQTKINGQRIELGEVEHHVQQNLAVTSDYRVVVEIFTPQERQRSILAAFITKEGSNDGNDMHDSLATLTHKLDEKLAERVPPHMIPSVYIPIDHLPMNTSGKIDRRRLREIGAAMTPQELNALAKLESVHQEPSTAIEVRLQDLWASILCLDPSLIGANDSFLKLGGDSITAMRLASTAYEQGLAFTVSDVFKNPRLSELAAVTKLAVDTDEEKVEPFSLLRQGLEQNMARDQVARLCGVNASQIEDIFPCTPLQEGLLALTTHNPSAYISRTVFELQDSVDRIRFRAAWEQVVASASILRTRIVDLPGQGLVQVVIQEPVQWHHESASSSVDRTQTMTLGTPLLRLSLDTHADRRCYFTLTMHHAVYDGWSMPLVMDQVEKAFAQEAGPAIVPFQPFVKHIKSRDAEQVQRYWRSQLEGSEATVFPTLPAKDYRPKPDQVFYHHIPEIQWTKQTGITASTIIRAAWAILASRHTDSRDVIFGAITTGRQATMPGIESIVGPTIGIVPIRIRSDPCQETTNLLQQIQLQTTDMTEFEQTGLQQIRLINNELAQASQFQTLMVVQPADEEGWKETNLFKARCTSDDDLDSAAAFNSYALFLHCQLERHGLCLGFGFDSSVVDHKWVNRLGQQLEHVIHQLCLPESASKPVSAVNWASDQDLSDIWAWNALVPTAVDKSVNELFASTVQKRPQAQAVCAWDGNFTYCELDAVSTCFAQHLLSIDIGLGPNVIVPLCFEKSKWTPVAMLGIMKTGAVCVALDDNMPDERLRLIVEQVDPPILISSILNEDRAKGLKPGAPVFVPEKLTQMSIEPIPLPIPSPTDLLYVVFTSGSSGTPKGVMVTHSNFSSCVLLQGEDLGFNSRARIYDFASYAFDLAWSNNLRSLVSGACICIPSQYDRENDVIGCLNRLNANWVVLTPSISRSLDPSTIPQLTNLVFGGEKLLAEDVKKWAGVPRILNGYGPAECTILSTLNIIDKSQGGDPSIGWGTGLNTWVVARDGASLVTFGGIGELWLEGPLVSAGYYSNPEQTAKAFVTDPSWLLQGAPGQPGRRGTLYMTGDLVRLNEDGSLSYIGRKDSQVKIRGQRVELGEIEHHVRQNLPDFQVMAEVIQPAGSNSTILAAFVNTEALAAETDEEHITTVAALPQDLEKRLAQQLPAHMVPSLYIPIRQVPMSATGKTDRRALREIGASKTIQEFRALTADQAPIREPSTDSEIQLRGLWADILDINPEGISADDNFLAIGGDSISAMRLVGAAKAQGLSLTVVDIFQHGSLSEMAVALQLDETPYQEPEPFSMVETGLGVQDYLEKHVRPHLQDQEATIADVLPVSAFQKSRLEAGNTVAHRDCWYFFVNLDSKVDVDRVVRSCQMLVANLDILRTIFIHDGSDYLQVVLQNPEAKIDVLQIEGSMAEACQAIYNQDLQAPAPLGSSFLRLIITHSEEGNVRLTMRISHAYYDGMSIGPLWAYLAACYAGEQLPAIPRYAGYIQQSIMHQHSGDSYWQSLLRGSQMTQLPTTVQQGAVGNIAIRRTVPTPKIQNATAASLCIALSACAIAKVTQSTDVVFGQIIAARAMLPAALQDTIGPCVNIVPVRVGLDETRSVQSALTAVQEQTEQRLRFETNSLEHIVRNCTDWPAATKQYGFTVQFQNINTESPLTGSELQGEEGVYEGLDVRQEAICTPVVDILVKPGKGSWELNVDANTKYHDRAIIEQLTEELLKLIVESN